MDLSSSEMFSPSDGGSTQAPNDMVEMETVESGMGWDDWVFVPQETLKMETMPEQLPQKTMPEKLPQKKSMMKMRAVAARRVTQGFKVQISIGGPGV